DARWTARRVRRGRSFQFPLELQRLPIRLGVPQSQAFERVDHRPRDIIVARLVVVGGHHVPWRPRRAAQSKCVAVRLRVFVPQIAIIEIARAELPILPRIRQSIAQPLRLLVARNMKEELDDLHAISSSIRSNSLIWS